MPCRPYVRDSPSSRLPVCEECEYRTGGVVQACAGMTVADLLPQCRPEIARAV